MFSLRNAAYVIWKWNRENSEIEKTLASYAIATRGAFILPLTASSIRAFSWAPTRASYNFEYEGVISLFPIVGRLNML